MIFYRRICIKPKTKKENSLMMVMGVLNSGNKHFFNNKCIKQEWFLDIFADIKDWTIFLKIYIYLLTWKFKVILNTLEFAIHFQWFFILYSMLIFKNTYLWDKEKKIETPI